MNKLINTDRLSNTANAIRWCNGLTTQYKVMDFEDAIYNCVNEYKKHIPNDTISITTNSLNILPSVLDLPIDSFTLQGNSYQFTTTGKNKIDIKEGTITGHGITITVNKDKTITLNGTVSSGYPWLILSKNTLKIGNGTPTTTAALLPDEPLLIDGTYTINREIDNNAYLGVVQIYNKTNYTTQLALNETSKSDTRSINAFAIYLGGSGRTYSNNTLKIQLEEGSTATSYEPYTNGASPNPDYPQDIEVVKGRNLFDKDNVNKLNGYINDELSFVTSNTARTFYISCKKNTTYTASKISSNLRWAFGSSIIIQTNYNRLTTGIRANANTPSITITTGANDIYLCVYYYSSVSETFTEQEILDSIQIEEGSVATPYTPYQNIGVVVKGKNLFDGSIIETAKYLSNTGEIISGSENLRITDYIEIDKNGGYLSISGMISTMLLPSICFYDSSKAFISGVSYGGTTTKVISIPSNAMYFKTSWRTVNTEFMIEYGASITQYEPYHEQQVNIPIGTNELCKVGNVSDELVIKDGKAKIIKRIGKVVLDGSENWYVYNPQSGTTELTNAYAFNFTSYANNSKSNYFSYRTGSQIYNTDVEGISNSSSQIIIRISKNIVQNINAFKNWLSTHNTIVYYQLATPTEINLGNITIPKGSYIETLTNLDTTYSVKYFKGV